MNEEYLLHFSLEELKEEVRQRELSFTKPVARAWLSGNPLLSKLIEACEMFMNETQKHGRAEDNPVFEAAMELVYGEDVWVWVNKIEQEQ